MVAKADAIMTNAREVVLARIRAARGDTAPPPIPRDYRTADTIDPARRLDMFVDRLRDYRATVVESTADGLIADLAATAATLVPDGQFVLPPGLPPGWAPPNSVRDNGFDPATLDTFAAVLTGCAAAAAETGTIALDASPDQGRRALTLIPDRHLCVVFGDQVVGSVPELIARLDPTRPLTLISGPSATSDIELQRVEGVHGPRTLVVLLIR